VNRVVAGLLTMVSLCRSILNLVVVSDKFDNDGRAVGTAHASKANLRVTMLTRCEIAGNREIVCA
jgi:hypothetical protein